MTSKLQAEEKRGMKDKYDKLRDKTDRIVAEGLRIKDEIGDLCRPKCASCLAAKARGNVDKIDFADSFGLFDSSEDICMVDARDQLAEKLGWDIY